MRKCPRCVKGQVYAEDGRLSCLACGWARDPEPGTLEKLLSNANPDSTEGKIGGWGDRVPADIEAIKARVVDRIRMEAANGR